MTPEFKLSQLNLSEQRKPTLPSLVGGNTETVCSKLKNPKRFLKPNLETLPKPSQVQQVGLPQVRRVNLWFLGIRLYRISKNSSGGVYDELLLEKGATPG